MKWTMSRKPSNSVSDDTDANSHVTYTVLQNSVIQENPLSKKRKLSGSSLTDFPSSYTNISDQMCNVRKVHTAVQRTPQNAVKRTHLNRKDLSMLRVQIAMISDNDGDRPIHVAVAQENLKLVQKLCALMLKASIPLDITNYLRQTPLHLAVMLGNSEIVELLLKCGSSITLRDRNGNSAVHLAVKSSANKNVLDLILSHPDTKAIQDSLDHEGYSALHYAVFKNNRTAVRCLHTVGAEMNVIDGKSGRSPLIHAILNQNEDMVRLLLECNANADIADYSGRTAFELALHASTKNIVRILEGRLFTDDLAKTLEDDSPKASKKTAGRSKRGSKSKKTEDLRTN
ncbi:B-cell lymphoma 3 protein-like [Argiope bruennichi]|uniref:B-cell lymphoma 3 protein like n=1 Tax=Argiope bruennichi TaxID=94029 RepID=A0A8T0E967_ARGBR|nr:B-cell lymphoma 3 protein-like [Argiope bruennichi]XP_055936394.1 B-cell lymphoma 3 protein-like [Argiope bruennichi]KAF8767432.1 B-cell lymphoma 3 protein like [Argiope bruennichi]